MRGWEIDLRLFGVIVGLAAVGLSAPAQVRADTLGEYKEEKHTSGGSEGSSEEDDEDDNVAGEIVEGVLSGIFGSDDDEDTGSVAASESGGKSARGAPQACRFDRFYGCMSKCDAERETCRQRCRRHADWLCGTSSARRPPADRMSTRRGTGYGTPPGIDSESKPFAGQFEIGTGLVEGGTMLTMQHRVRWGRLGAGLQASYMFNATHRLFEADVGPAVFARANPFVLGVRPSALLSFGNGVRPLVGGGVRFYSGYAAGDFVVGFDPMIGVINGKMNLHLRSSVVYRFGPTIFAKVGHDYRLVRQLSNDSETTMHGGFVNLGLRFD